jgi:uncharacterized protein (TIGR00255 family)
MALKSMTGFARAEGVSGDTRWHWEVRTVNGRGLDLRIRLPNGYDALEPQVRDMIAKRLARGSVSASLNVSREQGVSEIRVNEAALQQIIASAERVRATLGGEPLRVESLLAIQGVLQVAEASESEEEAQARSEAMLSSFQSALDGVIGARAAEGERLRQILARLIDTIEALIKTIAASPARQPEAIRRRLAEQVAKLLDASATFDRDRLHQEAVLLATKADVEEELKRLGAHVQSARELLASREPVGRRLDFLAQEFNREANTLCSKSNDAEITRMGLELKALIDQLREQVQNIE